MTTNFFYENRAHQLQRLCFGGAAKVTIPDAKEVAKLPEELRELYGLIAHIVAGIESSEDVNSNSRNFERQVVRLRFSQDPKIKARAVEIIKAIFGDAEYFSGLKPLPQYTASFAYELLFPTWLNLLTATMLPQASNGKPRMEGSRQGNLFQFLGKVHNLELDCEDDLIGYATFIASRYDAPVCEELLQRLADLFTKEAGALITSISNLEKGCKDARQFERRLRDFLVVRHSFRQWPAKSEHPISYLRPAIRVIPEVLRDRLKTLEQEENWNEFSRIARRLRYLIQSDQMLASEYTAVINAHPKYAAELLRFAIEEREDGTAKFLPEEAQACLAHLVSLEIKDSGELNVERVGSFAIAMAANLEGFNEGMLSYFCRTFLKDSKNRTMLLDACQSDALRKQLSDFVLERAQKTDDNTRFLQMMACATVFSPEELGSARNTLKSIDAVVANRSIGNKEFRDLVTDIQANLPDSLQYLVMPIMAAGGKDARLASLYLTLNEVAESFQSSGKVENFSVVRAKYSHLTNM